MITFYHSSVPIQIFIIFFSLSNNSAALCFTMLCPSATSSSPQWSSKGSKKISYVCLQSNEKSSFVPTILININHNTNEMKTERKGNRSGLSRENINLIKQGTSVIFENSDELMTTGGKTIKKRAYKNPHRWIETLDIGWLVHYKAVMVEVLQYRGSGTHTKTRCDKTSGARLTEVVSAL